jgi:hypothetical protein
VGAGRSRPRHTLVIGIVVLGSIIGFLAIFSIWAKRQALETNNWVDTSGKLLEDKEIRDQLATFMVDELYANVDVQGELQKQLPPQLQPLAAPAAAGIRQITDDAAREILQRPRVQQAWEQLNRVAHEEFINVVENDSNQTVTLDLGTIVEQVGSEAGIDVAGKLPPDAGQLTIVKPDQISTAQKVVDLVQKLAIVLTALSLLLFAAAIYLAKGWRREALRAVGFAFILVGIVVLFARHVAGNYVVDQLSSSNSVQPAVSDAWNIGTSLLDAGGSATIFYGIVIVLGAWLAGPGGIATSARRLIAPVLDRRLIGYGVLLLLLLLLFWWSPTEGFHRLPTAILIIALLVIGFEVLRRQTVREFPDETWEKGSERIRNAGQSLLDRRKT